MRREIERLMANEQFDVLVCDFLHPSVNVPAGLPSATVLFQHNVEAMIWKRHYEVQRNPLKRTYLYRQWRKSFAYERAACHRFEMVVAVSHEDAEMMRRDYGLEQVADVPTGVDTDYFRPGAHGNHNGGVRRIPHNLVFTGSMDWLPNDDAIQYFMREIMPLVKEQVPDMTLTIVGRNPYASLLELSRRDPSVVVTGRVEDVRPYIDEAAAYVVPLRIGGGTRLKIYEAMAMEQPIISTTIGAEGLPVRHGSHLLLADTPQDFAAAVVSVLRNQSLARTLSASAAQLVRAEFGWEQASRKFAEICCAAIRRKEAASRPQIERQESKRSLL
jgi:glycosyltransferase involved in cell wall biosynthesis